MSIRKFETMCFFYLRAKYLMTYLLLLRMLSTIFMDFQNKTSIGV